MVAFPAGNSMFKVNNRNTRTSCEICSKLTIKTQERRQWRRSGVFIVNFEHISHFVLVFLLLTLSRQTPTGFDRFLTVWLANIFQKAVKLIAKENQVFLLFLERFFRLNFGKIWCSFKNPFLMCFRRKYQGKAVKLYFMFCQGLL